MKRKHFRWLLAAEGVVCLGLWVLQWNFGTELLSAALAFPLGPIGSGLRALSLSGPVGNGAAVALYVLLSILPLLALLLIRRRRELRWEDSVLGLLTLDLFAALWLCVNPHLIHALPGLEEAGTAAVGGICWGTVLGYGVLRLVRGLSGAGNSQLYRWLKLMLALLAVIMVAAACYFGPAVLTQNLESLTKSNVGYEHLLGTTKLMLGLECIVNGVVNLLAVMALLAAWRLLEVLHDEGWSEGALFAVQALFRRCGVSLSAAVVLGLAFNLLQLLLIGSLNVVSVTVWVPVLPVALVLGIMVLSRVLQANKTLRDENDLFV